MAFKNLVRSLAHRNFRLFFIGQIISLTGSWMQQVALSWLVFQLTGSSFLLGATMFLGQIPCLLVSPFIGVLTDHWDRRRVLFCTQSLAMGQAFLMAALTLSGAITVWQIMALSLSLGLTVSFDMPARQAFLSEMVEDPKDLANAIAMNATMFNGARLFGPALAGLMLAQTSPGVCFLVNGISFLAVLWSLDAMRLSKRAVQRQNKSMMAGFSEGARYAWHSPPLRNILLLLSLGSFTGSVSTVLLPEYTIDVLHGDADVLGWLGSAMGLGALLAALFLASRRTVLSHGLWIGCGIGVMGLGILATPFAASLAPALLALFVTGFGLVTHIAAGNTIIQTIADSDKRGRIMGFYTMAILGIVPIGSLVCGALSSHAGLAPTFAVMGAAALAGSLAFLLWIPRLHRYVRPIYIRLKILPPVA